MRQAIPALAPWTAVVWRRRLLSGGWRRGSIPTLPRTIPAPASPCQPLAERLRSDAHESGRQSLIALRAPQRLVHQQIDALSRRGKSVRERDRAWGLRERVVRDTSRER